MPPRFLLQESAQGKQVLAPLTPASSVCHRRLGKTSPLALVDSEVDEHTAGGLGLVVRGGHRRVGFSLGPTSLFPLDHSHL